MCSAPLLNLYFFLNSLNFHVNCSLSKKTAGAEGSLTVWRAAEDVETEAGLTVDLQWHKADVQCRHGRPK